MLGLSICVGLLLGPAGASLPTGTDNRSSEHPKIEIFLLENQPIDGITRPKGLQLSESGRGPLTYVRKNPIFTVSKKHIAGCSLVRERASVSEKKYRWAVMVTLTKQAHSELFAPFAALQPKKTKWWTVYVNDTRRGGESNFHYGTNPVTGEPWELRRFAEIRVITLSEKCKAEQLRDLILSK